MRDMNDGASEREDCPQRELALFEQAFYCLLQIAMLPLRGLLALLDGRRNDPPPTSTE